MPINKKSCPLVGQGVYGETYNHTPLREGLILANLRLAFGLIRTKRLTVAALHRNFTGFPLLTLE